jgi:hypothetical protein
MFYNAVAAAYSCAEGQIVSATATPSSFLPNIKEHKFYYSELFHS